MEKHPVSNSQTVLASQSTSAPGSPALMRHQPRAISTTSSGTSDDYIYSPWSRHSADLETSPQVPPRSHSMIRSSLTSTGKIKPVLLEDKGPFSPRVFISKYGHVLPLRISIEKGYHGGNEQRSIAMGDTYNVHLVKHSQVAVLMDSSGATYNFPLSSPVQFAPVFNDSCEATSEEMFDRISDVLACKPLPRLLRATKHHKSDEKSSVEKNEIFVVQKVVQSPLRKKSLQVYSVTQNKEKTLPGDCVGSFTSDSYATRLHLPSIVLHFRDELPLNVKVHITDIEFTDGSDFPFHLVSEVSVLTEIQTETSILASTYWGESQGSSEEDQGLIEIPIDLPIEVSIFQPEKTEEKELDLFHRTRNLYERFDPSALCSIRTSSTHLSTTFRKGHEREGVQLQKPKRVFDVIGSRTQSPAQSPVLHKRPAPPLKEDRSPKQTSPPQTSKPIPLPRNSPGPQRKRTQFSLSGQRSLDSAHACHVGPRDEESIYQPLIRHATSEGESQYATISCTPGSFSRTGAKSQQAMLEVETVKRFPSAPKDKFSLELENAPPLIKQLISRIEYLEKQVASLNDKVEKLTVK